MPAVSWTAPPTFADTNVLSAAQLNCLSDDLNFLKGADRALAYSNASQSISTSSWTHVLLAAEEYDTNGLHDNSTNNWRLTIATNGLYVITGQIELASVGSGRGILQVRKNDNTTNATAGTRLVASTSVDGTGQAVDINVSTARYLAAGDYISLHVWQSTGASVNLNPGADSTWFSAVWSGD